MNQRAIQRGEAVTRAITRPSQFIGAAIGGLFAASAVAMTLTPVGPSGGRGGNAFGCGGPFNSDGPFEVVEIKGRAGDYIDAIQVVIAPRGHRDEAYAVKPNGGTGGSPFSFRLSEGEYITAIGGKYGEFIDSLYIETNKKNTAHWGGKGGAQNFYYKIQTGSVFSAFWGREGQYIDAIGPCIWYP